MKEKKKYPVREELPPLPQKTFRVIPSDVHSTLYKIIYKEGGVIPEELRMAYNKRQIAENAIKDHLATRNLRRNYASYIKGKENGKSKDKIRV